MAVDEAYPPHQFLDPHGQPTGFDVDLFRAVAEAVGLRYVLEASPWPEIRQRLEAGDTDLNPGAMRTVGRERLLDFSTSIATLQYAVFVRNESTDHVLSDLEGKRILVNRSGYHDDLAHEEHFPVEIVPADGHEEALLRLAAGEADAAVLLHTQGLYFMRKHGLENVRSLGEPLHSVELRFVVPEGHDDLIALLNEGLARVRRDGTYDRLYDEWFGVLKPPGIPLTQVLWALGAALLAVLVIGGGSALWSRSLQREVKRRTQELFESDARLRATLAAAQDVGFVVTEAPGDEAEILEFSEGAERLFAFSREEVLGQRAGILRSRGDIERHGSSLGDKDPEGRRTREAQLMRKTGESFPAFVVSTRLPEDGEHGSRLLYVVIDLTERVRAQEERDRLRARVHRSETMQALGRLAGGVAHDFNNVLTVVMGAASELRGELGDRPHARRALEQILESGRSAADLVRQLLDFGRRGDLSPQPTTWNEAVASLEALLARLLPSPVRMEVRPVQGAWRFRMDPAQAKQVVMNLVLNARDAIEGPGRIEVKTENRLVDGRPVAVLVIRDDGRGMDEETVDHAFEPFFTTKEPEHGTGLGLATVHSIADAAGGWVEVESAIGDGTVFRVFVPRVEIRGA